MSNPSVQTNPASNIGAFSARLQGEILSLGSLPSLDVSFEYGQSQGGPYPSSTTPETKSGIVPFHGDIAGLDSNTEYFFRARGWDGNYDLYVSNTPPGYGTVDPAGPHVPVAPGDDQLFTLTPLNEYFYLMAVWFDGVQVAGPYDNGEVVEWTIYDVEADHTVHFSFMEIG
jgi:hypothetical protein